MSYILDALRRLEQDKELAKRGTSPMEAVLVPDIEGVEEPERMRLWWVGGGIVLFIAAILLTYWITRSSLVAPTEHSREGAATQLSSSQPAHEPSPPVARPEAASSTFQPLPPEPDRTAPAPGGVTPSGPAAPPPTSPVRKPAGVAEPPPPVRLEARPQPAVTPDEVEVPSSRETAAMVRDEPEPEIIREWRGSEIKINAIAYSRDERNRFAVVNLKTVHEGDQLEGLAVVEIQENGIVFEEGGVRYRVLLGKR